MKITLDQDTLRQAVISHLQSVGVTADILEVDFRYTRVPYTVFANVEIAETAVTPKRKAAVVEREVVEPTPIEPQPILDPATVPAEEPETEEPPPELPTAPMFGG